LIKKIKNLETIISTNLVLDSRERVAKYIYNHTDNFFTTKNILIAEILSVSPETLSRILKFFKDHDIIDVKSKKIDKEALLEYFE
jgi:CRP/FNR family transcriptional regulator